MAMRRFFISVIGALLATMLAYSMVAAADTATTGLTEKAVEYARIGGGDYQNFVGNWDDGKYPLLYALIQSSDRYGKVFHSAAVMGATKPYAPDPAMFAKEMILVAARVMQAPKSEDADKCFEVERVVQTGQDLAVYYRFKEDVEKASHSIKNCLILRLPKRDYKNVFLFENGKQVGVLHPAQGQWSVPAMPNVPANP